MGILDPPPSYGPGLIQYFLLSNKTCFGFFLLLLCFMFRQSAQHAYGNTRKSVKIHRALRIDVGTYIYFVRRTRRRLPQSPSAGDGRGQYTRRRQTEFTSETNNYYTDDRPSPAIL